MNFINDPIKAKRVFITFLVLSIVFFLTSGVLGYLYYREYQNKNSSQSEKDKKISEQTKQITSLQKQLKTLQDANGDLTAITKKNENLTDENEALSDEIKSIETKVTKANQYNEFFKYLNSVIETHGGFTGWTDAEFEHAKSLAEETGNTSFVSDVNWAWYETTVTPDERIMKIWNDLASGIEDSLK